MHATLILVLTFLAVFLPALALFVAGLARQARSIPAVSRRR
jgi:predicted PurR-regulated permease PerM